MTPREQFVESVLGLLWDQWTLLGVRGVTAPSSQLSVAIGLEELIILSQHFESYDPRLRDEVYDWCSLNKNYISTTKLKGLQKGRRLRGEQSPDCTKRTHKSKAPDLTHPCLVNLRIRALFGVGARADIIFALLKWPAPTVTVGELTFIGYSKRNVRYALDSLSAAGVLKPVRRGNQLHFSWEKREELVRLVGRLPVYIPRWPSIIRVLVGFLDLLVANEKRSERLAAVATAKAFNEMATDFQDLDLEPPDVQWETSRDWILSQTHALRCGRSAMGPRSTFPSGSPES